MKATRSDVARLAGVSTATVSNVLNGSNLVKKDTADRVMDAVRRLRYRPDMVARSMTTKRSMQIGIVLEDVTNPYYGELIREFETAASEKNYFVNVSTGIRRIDSYFDNLVARCVDGVFVAALPYKFQEEKLYELASQGVCVITSGNVQADASRVSSIENDYSTAMREAMDYLAGIGHRRIAYISGLNRSQSYDLRCSSYLEAVEEMGLGYGDELLIDGVFPYATDMISGYNYARQMLQVRRDFSVIICGNDLMAMGAIKALQDSGLRVPEDVSVMGFDGIEIADYWSPSLTTMSVDKSLFGRKAFELLYENMTEGTTGYYKNKLELLVRASTAPCKR